MLRQVRSLFVRFDTAVHQTTPSHKWQNPNPVSRQQLHVEETNLVLSPA